MNMLASLGVILIFALLAGHLVKFLRIPEVTGYIVAGVAVGPSFLGWITRENLSSLEVFSQVALGLILFSIGSVFEITRFREMFRISTLITLSDALLAGALVTGGMILAGEPWTVSLLLGAIAMETAAATTLMVLRECNSEGTLTETLTGVIAINNIFCLMCFSLAGAAIDLSMKSDGRVELGQILYESLFPLVWQLLGSAALGYLIGLALSAWSAHVAEQGERLILMAGAVLVCVGFAEWFELSALISSLVVGATMVNLSDRSRRLYEAISRTDPPLYAIFFVIAGASLDLGLLPTVGVVGAVYVLARTSGKMIGTRVAARSVGLPGAIQNHMGVAMLCQAGLAIGLVLVTNQRFPALAPKVSTIVLAAVAVFELVGPLGVRFALTKAGEVRMQDVEPAVLLD